MTEINLLPWREYKREQEKKLFTTMSLIGIIIAAAIVFFIHTYAVHLKNNQTDRNQMLQREINTFNEQINEIKALKPIRLGLISRMSIVQDLQSTRTLMVHLFDELIKVMPPGVYVSRLERKHDIVSVWGYAESNTNISLLMRNIENNMWIQAPVLTEIKKMDEKKQAANNEFKLNFVLKPKY